MSHPHHHQWLHRCLSQQVQSTMQEFINQRDLPDRFYSSSSRDDEHGNQVRHSVLNADPPLPKSVPSSQTHYAPSSAGATTATSTLSDTPSLVLTDTSSTSTTSDFLDKPGIPLQNGPLLKPDDVVLDDDQLDDDQSTISVVDTPTYECCFWFLSCQFVSHDEVDWKTHCRNHLKGKPPPESVICSLCGEESISWEMKIRHLAEHHRDGLDYRNGIPDKKLFRYLWQQRIICVADYQELIINYELSHAPRPFVQNGGPLRDKRDRGRPPPRAMV